MLAKDLINNNIPRLQLQDSVGKALQLLNDFHQSFQSDSGQNDTTE